MNKKGKLALIGAIVLVIFVGALLIGVSAAKPECNDKIDNDGDGNIDRADSGCDNPQDNDETDCGDGICEGGETSGSCPADCGVPDSCSDTDGGNYIFTFGTTSGYLNNIPYEDDDYCVDTSNIMEYYCSGDYEQSSQQSCGTDNYGSPYCSAGDEIYKNYTDYLCSSGECDFNITSIFQEDCDSYDNYGSNYCISSSVYHDFYDYFCNSGECDNTVTPEWVEDCDYGCTGGVCDPIPDSCSDTDSGYVVGTQGIASGYLDENYYEDTDYCVDNSTLKEYYCIGDYEYNNNFNCALNYTACSSGACV